ncbi:MAG TPA: hypothetical protein VF587_11285 [Solirubrobacteraceae bacterium]|jgi:hypothetical protein
MPRIGLRRLAPLLALACSLAATPPASAAVGWGVPEQQSPTEAGPRSIPDSAIGTRGDVVAAITGPDGVELFDRVIDGDFRGPSAPPGAGTNSREPSVAVAPDGFAAFGYETDEGPVVARRSPAGDWTLLPAPPGLGELAIAGGGAITVVWAQDDELLTSTAEPGEAWSAPAVIATPEASGDTLNGLVEVGADAAGGLVVAYGETHPLGMFMGWEHRVLTLARPAGGAWTTPVEAAEWDRCIWVVQIAVNDAGDAAVLPTCHGVRLVRRPAGGSFSAPAVVVPTREPTTVTLAIGTDGDVAAAYRDWNEPIGVRVTSGAITGPLSTTRILRTEEDGALDPRVAPLAGDELLLLGSSQSSFQAYGSFLYSALQPAGSNAIQRIAGPPFTAGDTFGLRLLGDRQGGAVAIWHVRDGDDSFSDHTLFTATYGPQPDPPAEEEPAPGGEESPPPPGGDTGDGGPGAAPPVTEPRPPIRITRRLRLRIRGPLVASRRGVIRLRMSFDSPVRGTLRLTDRARRPLGRGSFRSRGNGAVRGRIVLRRSALRRLRRDPRMRVRLVAVVTTEAARGVRVVAPVTLRLARP